MHCRMQTAHTNGYSLFYDDSNRKDMPIANRRTPSIRAKQSLWLSRPSPVRNAMSAQTDEVVLVDLGIFSALCTLNQ